jgi:hypothetical protein
MEPIALWDVYHPTLSIQLVHRWRSVCRPSALATLYTQKYFLVLIYVRVWVKPRAAVWLEGLSKLIRYDVTGTRTRDLPASSIVLQSSTLLLDDRGDGIRVPVGSVILTSPYHPDRLWCTPNLTTHLQLVPRSRKRGCRPIHPLSHTLSWRSA